MMKKIEIVFKEETTIFFKIMELPPEVVSIIYEYARPYTHPRWREGSYSAQALKDSREFCKWYDLVYYDELAHDSENWDWVVWCRFNEKVLINTPEWRYLMNR